MIYLLALGVALAVSACAARQKTNADESGEAFQQETDILHRCNNNFATEQMAPDQPKTCVCGTVYYSPCPPALLRLFNESAGVRVPAHPVTPRADVPAQSTVPIADVPSQPR